MKDQVVERVSTVIATGAMANQLWLPYVEKVLSISLSSLGLVWLFVQIVHKLKHWK